MVDDDDDEAEAPEEEEPEEEDAPETEEEPEADSETTVDESDPPEEGEDAVADAEANADAEADANADAEAGADADAEAGADAEAEADAEADAEAEAPEDADEEETAAAEEETEDEETEDEEEEVEYGLALDDDLRGSREEFPDADDDDFEEDAGDWSHADYEESARNLFGGSEFFGETADDRRRAHGWEAFEHGEAWRGEFERVVPGAGKTVRFYKRGDEVAPLGFVSLTALAELRRLYPQIDLRKLHVTLPTKPRITEVPAQPKTLPQGLATIAPADKVDLRKHATPVGDQGQTSRCSAFAWTHALELLGNLAGQPTPRLSCSYTMLQFQRKQGDFKSYEYAYEGGDGTEPGVLPGHALIEGGTCRHDHWPNDDQRPSAPDHVMSSDAQSWRLQAKVYEVPIDEVRKLLTAGCPVHVSMNTGDAFSDLGRDGIFRQAEKPSGDHGRHAMLCVGYVGNYYIIKNSWGDDWGDGGYCYVPKKVLVDAEAEFVAIVPTRAKVPDPSGGPAAGGSARSGASESTVRCDYCGTRGPSGGQCSHCFAPLPGVPAAGQARDGRQSSAISAMRGAFANLKLTK